jgi:hypothetical protein
MVRIFFVKVLLLGLFTVDCFADFYAKQSIEEKELYVGQIFELDVETILLKPTQKVYFDFENFENVKVINPLHPFITHDDIKTHHKFYLQATDETLKTPDIVLTVIDNEYTDMQREVISGQTLHATKLNPPANFANVIAKSLIIEGFQNSVYDENSNIIAVKLFVEYGTFDDFTLLNTQETVIKEKQNDYSNQSISFYSIVDKSLESLSFSYFDLHTKTYKTIHLPINIERDTVSTQTELHPQKSKIYQLKVYGFLSLGILFLILFIFKRSYVVLALAAAAFAYLLYTLKPLAVIEVKKDTIVYILPTNNATAIVKTNSVQKAKKLSTYESFYKVEFNNGLIGWIKKGDGIEN